MKKRHIADKQGLPWKYCECGCHQHEISLAGEYYAVYWNLEDNYWVTQSHFVGGLLFHSPEEVEGHILQQLANKKDRLIKTKKEINQVLRMIKERGYVKKRPTFA